MGWNPEDPADIQDDNESDPSVKPGHRLLIKTAILMPDAKEGEVTIVQIESEGYNEAKVVVPIVAMRAGRDRQMYLDLLLPNPAKLTLVQGEGPIHLVGSHCVDFSNYRDTGAGEDDEDEVGVKAGLGDGDKGDTPVKEDVMKKVVGGRGQEPGEEAQRKSC